MTLTGEIRSIGTDTCHSAALSTAYLTVIGLGSNPGVLGEMLEVNLSSRKYSFPTS